MEENTEQSEAQKNQEVASTEEVIEEVSEVSPDEVLELKKKAEASSQNFERLKKAEAELKKLQEKLNSEKTEEQGLSNKDILFLAKADIHEEDVDTVLDWARFKKIPVSDAYKELKTTLTVKAEERRTAAATQTKGSPRGSSRVTGEDLLKKAEATGDVPDTADGLRSLVEARMARKLSKLK